MTEYIRTWTIEEALERAVRTPPSGASESRSKDHNKWGGTTFDDAVRLAREGDPESAIGLKRHLGVLASRHTAKRATSRWGESGSTVDVGAFLSGEPECMMETVPARRPAPVAKIAIERAVSWNVNPETMRATGASVLAVVEAMRTAGIPVEIWVTFTVKSWGGGLLSTQVLVQEAGRPIDLDVLAFWTVNPAAFRRVGFAIEEQEDQKVREECGISSWNGYGSPTATPQADFDEIAPANEAQVQVWVQEVLERRIGIDVRNGDEW